MRSSPQGPGAEGKHTAGLLRLWKLRRTRPLSQSVLTASEMINKCLLLPTESSYESGTNRSHPQSLSIQPSHSPALWRPPGRWQLPAWASTQGGGSFAPAHHQCSGEGCCASARDTTGCQGPTPLGRRFLLQAAAKASCPGTAGTRSGRWGIRPGAPARHYGRRAAG